MIGRLKGFRSDYWEAKLAGVEFVTLRASGTDALSAWMAANGFAYHDQQSQALGSYLQRGWVVVAARLTSQPGIDKIVDQRDVLKRLFAITRVFRVGVFAVALIMLIASAALIMNTVRMAVFARRKEIGIMRLVGATNWFIRAPFIIEGVIEGLLGSVAAIVGLLIMKVAFIDPLRGQVGFLPLIGMSEIRSTAPWLLLGGVIVAGVASLVAMRRFLEV